jgi:indolepyruvate ferredoxin oxidoreductase, beta subunit
MKVKNILITGLGGQGIILCSKMICDILFHKGYDVKKSEIHGMSQRGGSVVSQIRFGEKVYSPLIPENKIDYLIVLEKTEGIQYLSMLSDEGIVIELSDDEFTSLTNKKTLNVATASKFLKLLKISDKTVEESIKKFVKEKFVPMNMEVVSMIYSS